MEQGGSGDKRRCGTRANPMHRFGGVVAVETEYREDI